MVAKHFTELVAWQLADELNKKIEAVLATPEARCHRKFCDNTQDAADSVASNIAEGFKRYSPGEFARFLDFSLSSLSELSTKLLKMRRLRFGTPQQLDEISFLIARCTIATARLRRYLRSEARKRRRRR